MSRNANAELQLRGSVAQTFENRYSALLEVPTTAQVQLSWEFSSQAARGDRCGLASEQLKDNGRADMKPTSGSNGNEPHELQGPDRYKAIPFKSKF